MQNKDNIIIYNTDDWKTSVALYSKKWDVWMNQNQIAELFDTSKQNISLHIINLIKEWEISQKSVIKDYLTTGADWLNEIIYLIKKHFAHVSEPQNTISIMWAIW